MCAMGVGTDRCPDKLELFLRQVYAPSFMDGWHLLCILIFGAGDSETQTGKSTYLDINHLSIV
jgi:hypothetical protein